MDWQESKRSFILKWETGIVTQSWYATHFAGQCIFVCVCVFVHASVPAAYVCAFVHVHLCNPTRYGEDLTDVDAEQAQAAGPYEAQALQVQQGGRILEAFQASQFLHPQH